jgi:hypothetical protein
MEGVLEPQVLMVHPTSTRDNHSIGQISTRNNHLDGRLENQSGGWVDRQLDNQLEFRDSRSMDGAVNYMLEKWMIGLTW